MVHLPGGFFRRGGVFVLFRYGLHQPVKVLDCSACFARISHRDRRGSFRRHHQVWTSLQYRSVDFCLKLDREVLKNYRISDDRSGELWLFQA